MKKVYRKGFTLVEILVTTVVVAVLAAIVIPAVAKQVTAGDPARMVSDLNSVKTAIEVFGNNVRPKFPGDIEDLVNPIDETGDVGLDGASYSSTQVSNWKGPYLQWSLISTNQAALTEQAFRTANGYKVYSALRICSATVQGVEAGTCVSNGASTLPTNPYVTVLVEGLTDGDFGRLNDIIDGTETANSLTGLLRYAPLSGTEQSLTYFLTTPYTKP
ncbi:MAG: prepilin-type N-terminal cleavage/methylation domain-containing protein [Gemmatimonadaceae bacterium]|jgi:prepilin-type N-terminal cleavage/methylation domain-containing protein